MNATEERIAFHAAAHAVVARLRWVEIVKVNLNLAGRDSTGNVQTRSAAWRVERDRGDAAAMAVALEADAAVAMAGMISELMRRRGSKLRDPDGPGPRQKEQDRCRPAAAACRAGAGPSRGGRPAQHDPRGAGRDRPAV